MNKLIFLKKHTAEGWTLIELLITMSLLTLLATAAFPSYQQWVLKSHRQEAKTELLKALLWVERYQQVYGKSPTAKEWPLHQQLTLHQHYQLEMGLSQEEEIEIKAIPQKSQVEDRCGVFILMATGQRKNVSLQGGDIDSASCWSGV